MQVLILLTMLIVGGSVHIAGDRYAKHVKCEELVQSIEDRLMDDASDDFNGHDPTSACSQLIQDDPNCIDAKKLKCDLN